METPRIIAKDIWKDPSTPKTIGCPKIRKYHRQELHLYPLRADVSKYRPEVYKSEKSKILKKIHKVALGKLLT